MADAALLTNYQNFLYEKQAGAQITFPAEFVMLAELSGYRGDGTYDKGYTRYTRGLAELAGDRETFSGSNVRIPLQLNDVSASGSAEGATWPAAFKIDTNKATFNLADIIAPIAVTLDLDRDSRNGSTAAMTAIAMYVDSAYRAAARAENDMLHGNGDGLLCNVASATGSGSLVIDVSTSAPFDQLTPGRVVSILTRSNGADPGNGKRRKIVSVSRSGGTITVSTTAVASDGGSGNVTFSSSEGVYIDSSWSQAIAGMTQATATSGTFEGIDKAAVAQWQGIDATPSAGQPLSDAILDNAVYLARGNGVSAHDFGIAHPKVIDLYKQSKTSQVRYEPQNAQLTSGFSGIVYQGADKPFPLVKDLAAPRQKCRLVLKEVLRLYSDEVGPKFIDDDQTMWRFFTRAGVKEADLFDRVQLGVRDCGKLVTIGTSSNPLTEAA